MTGGRIAEEAWRPVVGFEGSYEVSDHGRVRSIDRVATYVRAGVTITRRHKGKMLRPGSMPSGHLVVALGRETNTRLVHVIVLEAFVGPCPPGMWCRHLDDCATNNHLSNICWGTIHDNLEDSYRNNKRGRDPKTGRFTPPRSEAA